MKVLMTVKGGTFTAEGECLEPAAITLELSELQLPEYRHCMGVITKEWEVDHTSAVFRHNRDIIVKGVDNIHDDRPMQGDRTRL